MSPATAIGLLSLAHLSSWRICAPPRWLCSPAIAVASVNDSGLRGGTLWPTHIVAEQDKRNKRIYLGCGWALIVAALLISIALCELSDDSSEDRTLFATREAHMATVEARPQPQPSRPLPGRAVTVAPALVVDHCETMRDLDWDYLRWSEYKDEVMNQGEPPPSEYLRRQQRFIAIETILQNRTGRLRDGCADRGVR